MPRTCPLCPNSSFKGLRELGIHLRAHHRDVQPEEINLNPGDDWRACGTCHQLYCGEAGVTNHRRQGCPNAPDLPPIRRQLAEVEDFPIDDLELFLLSFHFSLSFTHHTWLPLLKTLVSKLLGTYLDSQDLQVKQRSICAFLALPGVVRMIQLDKKTLQRPVDFLRGAVHSEVPYRYILAEAHRLRVAQQARIHPRRRSEAGTLRRIDSLAAEGRYSSAMGLTERLHQGNGHMPDAPDFDVVVDQVRAYHPAANDLDTLPQGEDPMALEFSPKEVVAGVSLLRYGSAPGADGWTFRLIASILRDENAESPLVQRVTLFLNSFLDLSMDISIRKLFATCRLVMLPKEDHTLRPIGIGECWYRFVGTLASKLMSKDVGLQLLPIQMSVGLSGGGEILARICQMVYDISPDMAVACLDITNAFNTIRRGLVYAGLAQYCPKLCAWYRGFYGHNSTLVDSNGNVIGTSATGNRQGDPLSFLSFCCGFQTVLIALKEAFAELVAQRRPDAMHFTLAYADDCFLLGDVFCIEEFIPIALDIFRRYGFSARIEKCKLIGRQVEGHGVDYNANPEGHVLLGCPVGTPRYRRDTCKSILEDMVAPAVALQRVSRQTAYSLLHYCVNARPNYLCRVIARQNAGVGPLKDFDSAIDRALCVLTGSTDCADEEARVALVRRLPQSFGGLGMQSYGDVASDLGHILSREITRTFVEAYLPFLTGRFERYEPTVLERTYERGTLSSPTEARKIRDEEVDLSRQVLLAKLEQQEDQQSMALLTSASCRHSARWVFWRGGDSHSNVFSPSLFREALRSRCLLPYNNATFETEPTARCGCRSQVDLKEDVTHCWSCDETKGLQKRRHDRIRDIFTTFIRGTNTPCRKEVAVGNCTPDILIEDGAESILLDVSIINPAAETYRHSAALTPYFAARVREISKRNAYRQEIGPRATFVPIVLESTGRFGEAAMEFVRKQAGKRYHLLSKLFSECAAAIAYYNAAMVEKTRYLVRRRRDPEDRNIPPAYLLIHQPELP